METITRNMPVLALRGLTAFPGQTMSFDAERDISIFALDNAMENDRRLLAVTQRELSTAEPGEEELYTIGTVCHILQIIKTSDTTVRVIVEGECRARLHRLWQKKPFLQAQAELLPETESRNSRQVCLQEAGRMPRRRVRCPAIIPSGEMTEPIIRSRPILFLRLRKRRTVRPEWRPEMCRLRAEPTLSRRCRRIPRSRVRPI